MTAAGVDTAPTIEPEDRIDFRTRPSPSPEGCGRAHERVQHLYEERRRFHEPDIDVPAAIAAAGLDPDLIGFWAMWHLAGGFDALVRFGMHPATVWRKIRRFRTVTGKHPDECEFDGIQLDATGFLDAIERSLGWCSPSCSPSSAHDDGGSAPHSRRCE